MAAVFMNVWVPGYVAMPQNVGGGGIGTSDGPLRNFDDEPLAMPFHDYQDIVGFRTGSGVQFRGKSGRDVWFHFPIPSPSSAGSENSTFALVAQRARLMWSSRGGTRLQSLHVWDGARARVLTLDGLNLAGDFSGRDNPQRPFFHPFLSPNETDFELEAEIFYGLGISVLIAFPVGSEDGVIEFNSAGARFHFNND
jgi:hypothetical protein